MYRQVAASGICVAMALLLCACETAMDASEGMLRWKDESHSNPPKKQPAITYETIVDANKTDTVKGARRAFVALNLTAESESTLTFTSDPYVFKEVKRNCYFPHGDDPNYLWAKYSRDRDSREIEVLNNRDASLTVQVVEMSFSGSPDGTRVKILVKYHVKIKSLYRDKKDIIVECPADKRTNQELLNAIAESAYKIQAQRID